MSELSEEHTATHGSQEAKMQYYSQLDAVFGSWLDTAKSNLSLCETDDPPYRPHAAAVNLSSLLWNGIPSGKLKLPFRMAGPEGKFYLSGVSKCGGSERVQVHLKLPSAGFAFAHERGTGVDGQHCHLYDTGSDTRVSLPQLAGAFPRLRAAVPASSHPQASFLHSFLRRRMEVTLFSVVEGMPDLLVTFSPQLPHIDAALFKVAMT